jgi:hypothetical protein
MPRFILSILAGLLLNILLGGLSDHIFHITGVYPPYGESMKDHSLLILAFSYRAVFMVLGGYLTAFIARRKARKAVYILGILGAVIWLAGAIAMWDYAYPWYNIIGIILAIPLTMAGYALFKNRHSP